MSPEPRSPEPLRAGYRAHRDAAHDGAPGAPAADCDTCHGYAGALPAGSAVRAPAAVDVGRLLRALAAHAAAETPDVPLTAPADSPRPEDPR